MTVSKGEIANAILDNDTARAAEMLEEFGFPKDGLPQFTSAGKDLVSAMLGAASVAAWREGLDEGLAHELIERTAAAVDIFQFLRLVMAAAEIGQTDFSVIPKKIRTALSNKDYYTGKIVYAIEKLDDEAFKALIAFIMTDDKLERIYVKFNLPIIRYIYRNKVIPAGLMFACMGLCPRPVPDEQLSGPSNALGVLGGLCMFGAALLNGMHGDDDGKPDGDKECRCGGCHGGCGGCHGCHSDN